MSSTAKVRWGILGVARINERLLPAFGRTAHAELSAIASRSPDRALQAARAANIPTAHGSYEALLDDPAIDVVYIPLPNSLHGEWVCKAADRGKHVLCEKPLAPTADEARAVVRHCRSRGVKLMDGFMWPHHPRTAQIRGFLDRGGIGEVRQVTTAFTFMLRPLDESNIRLSPSLGGGGLLDVGCYPIFGIRWAFGAEPVRVFATARYLHDVDVLMSGMLWMADGRVASFDCGFDLPFRGWMEIAGTEGVVHVPDMWLPSPRASYTIHREDRPSEMAEVAEADQIVCMLDHLSRAVLFDEPLPCDSDEAVKTLRVLDALARSAREGRVVTV